MTWLLGSRLTVALVSLTLPHAGYSAGRQVSAQFVDRSSAAVEIGLCPTLAREAANGSWIPVTHTHGVDVACPARNPVAGTVRAGGHAPVEVELYDDLTPGRYRVSLPYRRASAASSEPPFRAGDSPVATDTFSVTAFDPGPPPHLSSSRLRTIALRAARAAGDAHPTLVQVAEGSRFVANLVGDGDQVDAWNWSYLIAVRGHFPPPHISTPPGIPMGPGPVVFPYTVEVLVVDARTGRVTDSGGSDRYPRLSELGAVRTLIRR